LSVNHEIEIVRFLILSSKQNIALGINVLKGRVLDRISFVFFVRVMIIDIIMLH